MKLKILKRKKEVGDGKQITYTDIYVIIATSMTTPMTIYKQYKEECIIQSKTLRTHNERFKKKKNFNKFGTTTNKIKYKN